MVPGPGGNGVTTPGGTAITYVTATSRTAASAATGTRPLVLTRSDAAGKHTLKLLRAFRVSSLAPGRYRLRIAPVTADGTAAPVTTVYLWVLTPTNKARA